MMVYCESNWRERLAPGALTFFKTGGFEISWCQGVWAFSKLAVLNFPGARGVDISEQAVLKLSGARGVDIFKAGRFETSWHQGRLHFQNQQF